MVKFKIFSKSAVSLWVWVLVLIFITGCTVAQESHNQPNEISKTLKPTEMATTNQPVLDIDATPSEAISLLPSATPTIIEVPATLEPMPTLSNQQKISLEDRTRVLQGLMKTNNDCQLPCFWGVTIGDSLESVEQRFNSLEVGGWTVRASNFGNNGLMGSLTTGYYDIEERVFYLGISLEFYTDFDNRIQLIRISVSRPSSKQGEFEFVRDWQQYSLSSMLQYYGKPAQVYLRIRSVADVIPTPIYSLSLFYPDKGISITYNLEGKWLDENQLDAEICLGMKNNNPLEISLFNSNDYEEWAEHFPPYNDELYEQSTWETQLGMDLDTFYQTYQDPNNLDCIEIIN